jgi:rsbT co-antagonist protein RsbR
MSTVDGTRIAEIVSKHESSLLTDWLKLQLAGGYTKYDEKELRDRSRQFLSSFRKAAQSGEVDNIDGSDWGEVRDMLGELSRTRARQGSSPSETATFVLSLKQPIFNQLRDEYRDDADGLGRQTWLVTVLLDKLGLYTTELHQKAREEIISRQQQEMLELSTPVVALWDGILALPLIGTLDSARTQVVMESLLERIVETSASIAIIDITGVPTVDTLVAQHLLKTVAAARLMGTDCIISGIRPQIAQTIVHLGVELGQVITKATLADAFRIALQKSNLTVCKVTAGA